MPTRLSENYEREAEVPLAFGVVREAVRRNHHRTPLLLIDPEVIRSKVRRFRAAMPGCGAALRVDLAPGCMRRVDAARADRASDRIRLEDPQSLDER